MCVVGVGAEGGCECKCLVVCGKRYRGEVARVRDGPTQSAFPSIITKPCPMSQHKRSLDVTSHERMHS